MLTRSQVDAVRKKLKMNQKTFAAHIGVSEALVSLWLSGQRTPSVLAEKVICQVLAEATGGAQRRVGVAAKR